MELALRLYVGMGTSTSIDMPEPGHPRRLAVTVVRSVVTSEPQPPRPAGVRAAEPGC